MNKVERFGHFMIGVAFAALYVALLIMFTWTIRNTNMIFVATSFVVISQHALSPVMEWSMVQFISAFTGSTDYFN